MKTSDQGNASDRLAAASDDRTFTGSIPELYESHLVPLIFERYAIDLAARAAERRPTRVLEIAAGTGVVTRQLARVLPGGIAIVATDLSQAMLDRAAAQPSARPVEWRQADAMQLPYPDESFDLVVCQFGVMFFPDKGKAFAEARRVLRPGGCFLFNVWDRIEENAFADTVTQALSAAFVTNPPRFLVRIPHGYHDPVAIAQDLARGGFNGAPEVSTVTEWSRCASARIPAVAYCQGTPLRNEITTHGPGCLEEATETASEALAMRYGAGAIEGKIQAHIVAAVR